jgi:GH25 family lysozyme M1 (1,4-beta-N-acetylmuramidase)
LRTIWAAEEFDKIWMAQYNDKVTYKGKYYIWQRCDYGHIEGIDGNLDVDIMYLN